MTDRPVAIRLDVQTIAKLDRIADALSARAVGAPVNRSTAMRIALDRGIESLETELRAGKSKPKAK